MKGSAHAVTHGGKPQRHNEYARLASVELRTRERGQYASEKLETGSAPCDHQSVEWRNSSAGSDPFGAAPIGSSFALDCRGFDPHGRFDRAGSLQRTLRRTLALTQRTRMRYRARHQHLGSALMMEIAVSEAHAGHRSAEADFVVLFEVEARLEREATKRSANRLPADLQRITGQPHVADGTGAAELHRTGRPHVVKDPARAAGAVNTGEGEHLAGYEALGLLGIHLPGRRGHGRRNGYRRPQHKTRKHASTPTLPRGRSFSLPAAYHTNRGNIGAASLVKSECRQEIFTTILPRTWPARILAPAPITSSRPIS